MATATVQAPYGFSSSKSAHGGPDPKLVADQLRSLNNLYKKFGPEGFSENMMWILRKNPEKGEKDVLPSHLASNKFWNRRLIPFRLNNIQRDIIHKLGQRNICLKPRQGGFTTFFMIMRLFLPCILSAGSGGLLISQNHNYATLHFAILQRALRYFAVVDPYDNTKNLLADQLKQHLLHTKASNRRELLFDQLDSRIVVESAEIEEAGQGLSLNHVHATEVARWPGNPEETLANMKEAIPIDGTLDLESTANGMGGYFFEECMRAMNAQKDGRETEFKFHFYTWFWHEEYTLDRSVKEDTITEEEQALINAFKVDLYQIAWRRKKLIQLRHNFAEKYPESPETAFLVAGKSFFDKEILRQRWLELSSYQPLEIYKKLKIFKRRIKNKRYLIAADVATGLDVNVGVIKGKKGKSANDDESKLDWSAAVVIDIESGEEVAAYRAHVTEEEYAWELAELGRLYNNALIAVERTGYGGTVIITLEVMCQYTNLYKHRDWWKKDKKTGQMIEFLGFPTSMRSRPVALNRLRYLVHDSPELIHDIAAVEEMLNFVINEKGRPAAAPGCHDDTVMCRAIAAYVRAVLLGYLDPLAIPREKYSDDPSELEDEIMEERAQEFEESEE